MRDCWRGLDHVVLLRLSFALALALSGCGIAEPGRGAGEQPSTGVTPTWTPARATTAPNTAGTAARPGSVTQVGATRTNEPSTGSSTRSVGRASPDDFAFIFEYGSCWSSRLDTFAGTYSREEVLHNPAVTIELVLTPDELDTIYRKMEQIGFFQYPEQFAVRVPQGRLAAMVEPASKYHFQVRSDGATKEVRWHDNIVGYTSPEADRLRELIRIIEHIIQTRPGVKDTRAQGVGCV